jgi:peptidyl-prolyl cis-trans isomerase SurA
MLTRTPFPCNLLILLSFSIGIAGPSTAEPMLADRIEVVVEDDVITSSEVTEQLQIFAMDLGLDASSPASLIDSLRVEVLGQLVENALVVSEAKRRGIEVDDEEVEQVVDDQLREQVQRLGGEAPFQAQLEAEGVTLKQMRNIYERDVRRQLLSTRLVQSEVDTEVEVTDDEVRAYFAARLNDLPEKPEEVRLRHLLVRPRPPVERTREARETLDTALVRIRAGEDFATVAREVSQDPTAERGGDLGYFARGDFADEAFSDAAFSLADTEVSEVVTTGYGLHIIQRLATTGEKIRARHIVIPHRLSPEDVERARTLAETVSRRLSEGADFVDMVRAYSDAPEADGDVGYFAIDGLFPQYRDAVTALDVGGNTPVLQDEQGYHIFHLLERKPATPYTFEELEPQIRSTIKREELAKRYRTWVDELKKTAYIDYRNDAPDAAAPAG